MEFIDPKKVHPGKIKHEQLDPEWEEIARRSYQVVGHLVKPTYEQWELDFLRDHSPEEEMFLWLVISDAFEIAVAEHPDLDEKAILGDLICISAGGPVSMGWKKPTWRRAGNTKGAKAEAIDATLGTPAHSTTAWQAVKCQKEVSHA